MKSARKLLGLALVLSLMIGCFAALGVSAYADEGETVVEEVVGSENEAVVEEVVESGNEAIVEEVVEPKNEAVVEEIEEPENEVIDEEIEESENEVIDEEKIEPEDEIIDEKKIEPENGKKDLVKKAVKLEGTHEHALKKIDGQPATCQDGWADYYHCEGCGKYFSDPAGEKLIGNDTDLAAWKQKEGKIPAKHNFEKVPGVYPNCVEEGYYPSLYCKDCKKYFTDNDTPKLIGNGSYEAWFEWACTSANLGGGKLNPLGHIWSCWHVCKYPTKTYDGLMVRCCEREGCGAREFRSVRYDCCPKTGDESNIALWATMCALSVMMLGSAAVIVIRRRKNGTF